VEADPVELDGEVLREAAEEPGQMRLRRPKEPTAAERLEHEILHEPYRAWCQACVSGRGRYEYHRSRDHGEDAIPTIGVDYGYLASSARASEEGLVDSGADDGDLGGSAVLCGRCSADGWLDGYVLPAKGVEHPYCIDALTSIVKGCAFRRVLLKSDNEPAILALTQRTAAALRTETAIEVTVDPARQGDKDANGLAEGGREGSEGEGADVEARYGEATWSSTYGRSPGSPVLGDDGLLDRESRQARRGWTHAVREEIRKALVRQNGTLW